MRRTISRWFVHSYFFLLLLFGHGASAGADRLVMAPAKPAATAAQVFAAAPHFSVLRISPWQDIKVEYGNTLSGIFSSAGLNADQWRALLKLDEAAKVLKRLHPGDKLRLRKAPDGRLAVLQFEITPHKTLVVRRTHNGLAAKIKHKADMVRHIRISGTVQKSLSAALRHAGAPTRVAAQLVHVFEGRENLPRRMQAGDRFSLIYKAQYIGGEQIHVGPVIAASLHAQGRSYRAFRRVDENNEAHYYDAHGQSYELDIRRTPLAYSHVSSSFSLHRRHPITGVMRAHTGVDLAAPRGTPVQAAADGVITYIGRQSGYGRIINIKHASSYTTRYAHLSGFSSGLRRGDYVVQGQTIGYVGHSGLATGNHLHFEIRKNGIPRDPMTMALPSAKPLSGPALAEFTLHIQPLVAQLNRVDYGPAATLIAANIGIGPQQLCAVSDPLDSLMMLTQDNDNLLNQVFCSSNGQGLS